MFYDPLCEKPADEPDEIYQAAMALIPQITSIYSTQEVVSRLYTTTDPRVWMVVMRETKYIDPFLIRNVIADSTESGGLDLPRDS
jgi:cell fate regulator YaaT (PSP1 superfamily)